MTPKGTVLLVEDNTELNNNNSRSLKLLGYDVFAALTLSAARACLHRVEPDIILLDVLLPDGDGIDFCAEIRGATGAHILFLTSRTEHGDILRGLAVGGDDYITKPFSSEELFARVEAAMRRRNMGPGGKNEARPMKRAEAEKLHAFAVRYDLTEKEHEALSFILRKLSIKEMAESMGVSDSGVEKHIARIFGKTGVNRQRHLRQRYAAWVA